MNNQTHLKNSLKTIFSQLSTNIQYLQNCCTNMHKFIQIKIDPILYESSFLQQNLSNLFQNQNYKNMENIRQMAELSGYQQIFQCISSYLYRLKQQFVMMESRNLQIKEKYQELKGEHIEKVRQMGERQSQNRRLARENYFMEEKIRELEVEIQILKGINFVDGSFCQSVELWLCGEQGKKQEESMMEEGEKSFIEKLCEDGFCKQVQSYEQIYYQNQQIEDQIPVQDPQNSSQFYKQMQIPLTLTNHIQSPKYSNIYSLLIILNQTQQKNYEIQLQDQDYLVPDGQENDKDKSQNLTEAHSNDISNNLKKSQILQFNTNFSINGSSLSSTIEINQECLALANKNNSLKTPILNFNISLSKSIQFDSIELPKATPQNSPPHLPSTSDKNPSHTPETSLTLNPSQQKF